MDPQNIFETGKPHLKKLVMITHHLVVFIQHNTGELRGLYERGWPSYFTIVLRKKNVGVRGVQILLESWRQTPAIAGDAFSQLFLSDS
jgi:hypothetical protein